MALTWYLTEQHDLMVVNGKLVVTTSADEVRQRILVTLLHHWQEYFLNVPAGLPWFEFLLGSKDKKLVEAVVRQAILDTPGVQGIVNFYTTFETRGLSIYADVETIYGIIAVTLSNTGGN